MDWTDIEGLPPAGDDPPSRIAAGTRPGEFVLMCGPGSGGVMGAVYDGDTGDKLAESCGLSLAETQDWCESVVLQLCRSKRRH